MYLRKRYGASRVDSCPFCGKQGVVKSAQGIPVCIAHRKMQLSGLKCACGSYVDIKEGKWGAYANCLRCGNINLKKVLEMNPQQKAQEKPEEKPEKVKTEITVRSDELDFLY
ncbi:hypothetical protein HYX10_00170 [Candidatus Woesearchaeota archaeon]|nr:hypothetical protein [Candidatus Woesearchaeota archaeon]